MLVYRKQRMTQGTPFLVLWIWICIYPSGGISQVRSQQRETPYQLYNYSWLVKSGTGNVVNSSSQVGTIIEIDLCSLVLGASSDWGVPDVYPSLTKAPDLSDWSTGPGCSTKERRITFAYIPVSLYACPGSHRYCSLSYKCGHAPDNLSASWGCETTEDTYWSPSFSWDLITIKRKNPVGWVIDPKYNDLYKDCDSSSPTQGWCNPLVLSFTEAGKNFFLGKTIGPLSGG